MRFIGDSSEMGLFEIGAGFSAASLASKIDMLIITLLYLWCAWVIYKQYLLFGDEQITLTQFIFNSLKAATVVTFLTVTLIIY